MAFIALSWAAPDVVFGAWFAAPDIYKVRPMKRFSIPLLLLVLAIAPAQAARTPARPAGDPVMALLDRAHAAKANGDTELALRLAQSAIVADPARPASYVALGNIYADLGRADYARCYYDEALAIDPMEPAALTAVAALDRQTKAVVAKSP
jgi:tetratricopeptide (TPR) repeat protein